jgi:hypothetical protein
MKFERMRHENYPPVFDLQIVIHGRFLKEIMRRGRSYLFVYVARPVAKDLSEKGENRGTGNDLTWETFFENLLEDCL